MNPRGYGLTLAEKRYRDAKIDERIRDGRWFAADTQTILTVKNDDEKLPLYCYYTGERVVTVYEMEDVIDETE